MIDWRRLRGDRRALALAIGIPAALVVLLGFVVVANPFAAEPSPSPSPLARATPTPTPFPTPEPTPTATPEPTPTPTPTPTPQPAGLRDGRLTVLVLGSDDSRGRQRRRPTGEYLTDAITVLSVKSNGRRLAMFSLPRDTVDLRLGDGSTWSGKINSLSYYRGPGAVRSAMQNLLGIPIDYYVQLDMDDFRSIVSEVGALRVRVPYALRDTRCQIRAGRLQLNAERALCYARHRYSDSDFARAGRHQQLLLALRDALLRSKIRIPALIRGLGSLRTDIPMGDLPAYADFLRRTRDAQVSRLILAPPRYTTFAGISGQRGWIQIPDVAAIRAAVAAVLNR